MKKDTKCRILFLIIYNYNLHFLVLNEIVVSIVKRMEEKFIEYIVFVDLISKRDLPVRGAMKKIV